MLSVSAITHIIINNTFNAFCPLNILGCEKERKRERESERERERERESPFASNMFLYCFFSLVEHKIRHFEL